MRKDEQNDERNIEGLAAQLYSIDGGANIQVWWHLLRIEIKNKYRKKAETRISKFNKMCEEMDKRIIKVNAATS